MYEAQRTGIFMHHPYRGEGLYINDIEVRGGMYQLLPYGIYDDTHLIFSMPLAKAALKKIVLCK